MTPFKLAYCNLTRRKAATLIVLLAIGLSVATSGILLRLYLLSGSRFSTMAHAGDAIVGAKAGGIEILLNALNSEGPYPGFLPMHLYESLKQKETVHFEDGVAAEPSYIKRIVPVLYFGKYKDFRVMGTDQSFPLHLFAGRWATGSGEVVLGASVAQQEGFRVGDIIRVNPWTGDIDNIDEQPAFSLKVTGIFKSAGTMWDKMLFSNLTQAKEILRHSPNMRTQSIWGADVLNYFLIYTQVGGFEALNDLINKRTVGQAILVADEKAKLENLTSSGRNLGLMMSLFIIFLGALSVAAMLITRFESMTVQTAILHAIGFRKSEVVRWLLWEGLLLGVAACVLGACIDFAAFPFLRMMLDSALPSADLFKSSILQSAPIWSAAILSTMVAVIIPLIRIFQQDSHLSLRSV